MHTHLEHFVQFWSPLSRKDIEKVERIQRRIIKIITKLRNKLYEEQLTKLDLFPLTKLRLRGDLIAVFKIFKGYTNVNPDSYFTVDRTNITRNKSQNNWETLSN